MKRQLEPELMLSHEQVKAYAEADFSGPNQQFISQVKARIDACFNGLVLDLGCGPGDISMRFAEAFGNCKIDAIDGSEPMINYANNRARHASHQRIHYSVVKIPHPKLSGTMYDLVISNSLLHHLHDPGILWNTIKQCAKPGARICIMDLFRPNEESDAQTLVKTYAQTEPEILQQDFYNSLLAAFTIDEIKTQLDTAELDFSIQQISDRHIFIYGILN